MSYTYVLYYFIFLSDFSVYSLLLPLYILKVVVAHFINVYHELC